SRIQGDGCGGHHRECNRRFVTDSTGMHALRCNLCRHTGYQEQNKNPEFHSCSSHVDTTMHSRPFKCPVCQITGKVKSRESTHYAVNQGLRTLSASFSHGSSRTPRSTGLDLARKHGFEIRLRSPRTLACSANV